MLSLPETFTQFTELGEADIGTLHGDHVSVVVIHIRNARLLRNDWAPAVQILQDQWHADGKPLGGVLSTRDSCRFYTEPTAGDGPPQRLEHQGRSEFAPPVDDEHPEVLLAFLWTCLDGCGASGLGVDPS
ncbi:uncharacterized protein BO66DRAFT_439370 [Aspergillus aculeatinus CBS 121060]|uniref:Uncharacterized protein n=1 Tax=Aspergillus aculeatinus CBS 121060 TaxID=1448322 RepID=A0ACD1H717_9EURO|nr:hypothetical protein BO66DRAFT_439370 [Aspergillus aculeatinus CBS 121060]RAH69300.1 hypothetical protein BO66DRAFT_439370 [Aspergillus aculeatinus CBS 121060]